MKISLEWLNDFTPLDMPVKEFCDAMTISGSKVEGFEIQGQEISNVVTGRILSIQQHPDADRLVICRVDTADQVLQIVTGAANISVNDIVPVALNGSTLSGGLKIKKGKLRGQVSEGMLCSIQELGYSKADFPEADEDGIFILPADTQPGKNIKEILGIDDTVIEFEITSNRVDCFSAEGLGREAAATFNLPFNMKTPKVSAASKRASSDLASVVIDAPDLCYRYCARVVENVIVRQSPEWLRRRLRGAGVRPINNIVDITNYVMLELGQPMHAFDLNELKDSSIIVRRALKNEELTTLDGSKRLLDNSMLVIADSERAVALAGVMGAENSEISAKTTSLLLESATFNPVAVRMAAKKVGLRTEASSRFEKGLDSNLALRALDRACELIEMLESGEVCQGTIDQWPVKPEPVFIELDAAGINNFLGTSIPVNDMLTYLSKIGCSVQGKTGTQEESVIIKVPSYRPDLMSQADLAEEIARLYDYNNIEPSLLSGKSTTLGGRNDLQNTIEKIKDVLIGCGYFEACTYSFESPRQLDKMRLPSDHKLRRSVEILNPLGEDYSSMRTSMVPSLMQIASFNSNRSTAQASIFEIAFTYHPKSLPLKELPDEVRHLSAFRYNESNKDFRSEYLNVKGMLEALLICLGISNDRLSVARSKEKPWLHPGQSADLYVDDIEIGWIGRVHPDTAEQFAAPASVVLLDVELEKLISFSDSVRKYVSMPKYPAADRDIALICDINTLVSDLGKIIRLNGGQYLESVELFDIYQGSQISEGKKSVAFNLKFRASDKTLSDNEVQTAVNNILESLKMSGVTLRE
jgi:phenylalanyl-tRNA synthetase beta chain